MLTAIALRMPDILVRCTNPQASFSSVPLGHAAAGTEAAARGVARMFADGRLDVFLGDAAMRP